MPTSIIDPNLRTILNERPETKAALFALVDTTRIGTDAGWTRYDIVLQDPKDALELKKGLTNLGKLLDLRSNIIENGASRLIFSLTAPDLTKENTSQAYYALRGIKVLGDLVEEAEYFLLIKDGVEKIKNSGKSVPVELEVSHRHKNGSRTDFAHAFAQLTEHLDNYGILTPPETADCFFDAPVAKVDLHNGCATFPITSVSALQTLKQICDQIPSQNQQLCRA